VKNRAPRGAAAIAAVAVNLAVPLAVVSSVRAADDAFAWAPAHAPAVARGRQSGARFGLVGLTEIEVEVDDLYDAANRQALGLAERRLAAVPGVRAVFGPAGLLDVIVDGSGKPSARPVLARGKTESAWTQPGSARRSPSREGVGTLPGFPHLKSGS